MVQPPPSTRKPHRGRVVVISAYGPVWVQDETGRAAEVHIGEWGVFVQMFKGRGIKVMWRNPGDARLRRYGLETRRVFSQLLLRFDQWIWLLSPPRRWRNENTVSCLVHGANRRAHIRSFARNSNEIPALRPHGWRCGYARAPSSQDVFRTQRGAPSKQSVKTFGLGAIRTSWRSWSPAVMNGIVLTRRCPLQVKESVAKTCRVHVQSRSAETHLAVRKHRCQITWWESLLIDWCCLFRRTLSLNSRGFNAPSCFSCRN